jgi:ectoine hydroxylase-related dioxygenase (phytanoyl-CoA dioxygenase family)
VQTALQIPQSLYDQAERAARSRGVSVAEFIAEALEEKLRAARPAGSNRQRVRLPLIPSARPGTRQLTAEHVAELMDEDDVPR